METKGKKKGNNKWTERHFQLCLAIISRTERDLYGHTKSLNLHDVIAKADRMISLLKERYTSDAATCENIGNPEKSTSKVAK